MTTGLPAPTHCPLSLCFLAEFSLCLRSVYLPPSLCACLLRVYVYLFPVLCLWHRTKRTLGLGSLYGENDLLDLDGDPLRERQMAEKQLAALGDIL